MPFCWHKLLLLSYRENGFFFLFLLLFSKTSFIQFSAIYNQKQNNKTELQQQFINRATKLCRMKQNYSNRDGNGNVKGRAINKKKYNNKYK